MLLGLILLSTWAAASRRPCAFSTISAASMIMQVINKSTSDGKIEARETENGEAIALDRKAGYAAYCFPVLPDNPRISDCTNHNKYSGGWCYIH